MALSPSKPTAVHVGLVFCVLLSIILGTLCYVEHGTATDAAAKSAKAVQAKNESEKLLRAEIANVEELARVILGATDTRTARNGSLEVGDSNVVDLVTKEHFSKFALGQGEQSYQRLVEVAVAELQSRNAQLAQAKLEQGQRELAFKELEKKYNDLFAAECASRDAAESQLVETTRSKDEAVASLEKDRQDLRKAYSEISTAMDNARRAFRQEQAAYDKQIERSTALNTRLKRWLSRSENDGFEVPTGFIRYVDTQNRLAYINLGKSDRLPERMTFNVYNKSSGGGKHSGTARGAKDIKGAIEVVRIVNAHVAECRITREDIFNPMAEGDPIYTPLWEASQQQRFAFVGVIDIDNDGTDDRQELYELLKNVDAVLDAELLPAGELRGTAVTADNPTGITEKTRFLVLGKLPELQPDANPVETDKYNTLKDTVKKMTDSAREHGVRVITLTDFLNYNRYKASRPQLKPAAEPTRPAGTEAPQANSIKPPRSNGVPAKLFPPAR